MAASRADQMVFLKVVKMAEQLGQLLAEQLVVWLADLWESTLVVATVVN